MRDLLRFEGPLGSFYLREDSDKPIVMVASGTGFAPIKAICEHALEKKIEQRPITLYWGCRRSATCTSSTCRNPGSAREVHSRCSPTSPNGRGRTGFVHRAVMEDFPDMSGIQVYACGAPMMVEAARADFSAQCGLPPDEFYADSFLTEADKAATA